MTFTLPEVHEIEVELDGRRFEGAYYVVLGDLIVNYNGRTSSVALPTRNASEIAIDMLRDLVRLHYVDIEAIPSTLPQDIRLAAHAYLNSFDDVQVVQDLVATFGDSTIGSDVHKRLSWLCVNSLGPIVPCWKMMCDGDEPERTLGELRRWLDDPAHVVDWDLACRPSIAIRNGSVVGDCDACRLEPLARAVASTADYLHTANASSAVAAICSAYGAYAEGCHPQDAPDDFEEWVVFSVLSNSYECTPVD